MVAVYSCSCIIYMFCIQCLYLCSALTFNVLNIFSLKRNGDLITTVNEELKNQWPNVLPQISNYYLKEEKKHGLAIGKNISLVLNNLLKNYQSSEPPNYTTGAPTIIKTNMLIRSMGPISEIEMDYSMDCYFRQYWRDSRLSFMGPIHNLSLSIKMLEKIWRPDTYILNGKQSYVHTITVPNKLLRINQDGDILYSMRLTIKANCPMSLRNFPMDRQSCPLILGSYAYPVEKLVYHWTPGNSISFAPGMAISQFDFLSSPKRNFTFTRREGDFSLLQVNFNLQRHTGYFLIHVYVPCVLIVVLSWVSFWIHREATSDRIGLGITTVLTLSTISLDSRTDLPKVCYATALDWFLLMSFFYCIATILEFAAVHYFTKTGTGEIPFLVSSEEIRVHPHPKAYYSNVFEDEEDKLACNHRIKDYLVCSGFEDSIPRARITHFIADGGSQSGINTLEKNTQTEHKIPKWKLLTYCLVANEKYRKKREQEVSREGYQFHINSVSRIDRAARVLFPASFGLLNMIYWIYYITDQEQFVWKDPPAINH